MLMAEAEARCSSTKRQLKQAPASAISI